MAAVDGAVAEEQKGEQLTVGVPIVGRALFACILLLSCNSFLLIGYDNGVLGGVIDQPAFKATFSSIYNPPDNTLIGLIVSLYELGCFFGAIMTFVFGEKLGRRWSMIIGAIAMLIGALLQATAYSVPHIIVGRIVSGIGMGWINSTAPVYQSEFSPGASRGLYACAQLSTLNFGIFLSYWIGYGFSGQTSSYAWRVPVILQCIFVISIGILAFVLPETPRWLIAHGRLADAHRVFTRVYGSSPAADAVFRGITSAVAIEDRAQAKGWAALFRRDDIGSRRRLALATFIQFAQQLGGINGIIYYAGTIFSTSLGFDSHLSALMSGFLNTWFFVASFIPYALIDRVGRKPLIIPMVALMAAVFAIQAGLVKQVQDQTSIQHSAGIGAAAMLFIYQGAFTIGFQATVWVYPPEILPLRLRQRGTALATAANWAINFVIVQVTPSGIANIGWKYYVIYAVFNACFVPVFWIFYPETKGLELEDVDRLFARGRAVEDMQRARERMVQGEMASTGNLVPDGEGEKKGDAVGAVYG